MNSGGSCFLAFWLGVVGGRVGGGRVGLGGEGGKVRIHVIVCCGLGQVNHGVECAVSPPGDVSKVMQDGIWEERGVKGIFYLFKCSGQQLLEVLEVCRHGGGDGLVCWSGVGCIVVGAEEGSALSSGSFNAVPKFAD